MKVGGGIVYVEGPMGAGKTLYGVRSIVRRLRTGGYVVTNIELYPDAFERIARRILRVASRATVARVAGELERRFTFTTDVYEAFSYGVKQRGKNYEPMGELVWDETHNDLGNRTWRGGARQSADERQEIVDRATQLRKLGMIGKLLSQHADNTDKALRRVANWHVYLFNQKQRVRVLGIPVSPLPLFLAYWCEATAHQEQAIKQHPVKVERFLLDWHRHLYDTHGLYAGLRDGGDLGAVRWLDELATTRDAAPELPPAMPASLTAGGRAPLTGSRGPVAGTSQPAVHGPPGPA